MSFDEFGHILKVSLPTDFSLAAISGCAPGTTPETLAAVIRGLDLDISIDSIHILEREHGGMQGPAARAETRAIVKVEDPLFAKKLSARLESQGSNLSAASLPIDVRRTNCRKVYISWHKATRNAWLNFGNGEIAKRVAQKFNDGKYKILGHHVSSSTEKQALGWRSRGSISHNRVAWTIILSNVPQEATSRHIESAVMALQDKPRHVEMGHVSYQASPAEVSVDVRLLLEEHGLLENFHLASKSGGKRTKATALFQSEADARSACTLDRRSLPILKGGKLTVTLIQSAKVKIPTAVYLASKDVIEQARKTWSEQNLAFHVYWDASQRFSTLRIQGDNSRNVASARKVLDKISNGATLVEGESALWSPALLQNGSLYNKLKSIEHELQVKIHRNKSKRQLQFFGPPEKFQPAVRQVSEALEVETSIDNEIILEPQQFRRMIQGGFKHVERALGENVAVFNVVLRKITVNGTMQQYDAALAIVDGKRALESSQHFQGSSGPGTDCPICFCEAETPVRSSCEHIYCLECFEEYCKSAASMSEDEFRIKCQGNEGKCANIFNLLELKDHLSSLAFEKVLRSSFEEFIQRHTEVFRYCPTPDCGFIYRCARDSDPTSSAYTCPNCFEPICTSCHARHGGYSCADYKDIASGGHEALERLKRELNIKDCPKCTTPMEKTEGCNHMTCGGCKSHICWVCMAIFKTDRPCYDHMNREHGGIGLEFPHLMN